MAARCTESSIMLIISGGPGYGVLLPSRGQDEVWPGLFVGEADAAKNLKNIHDTGFTHVLNCCEGSTRYHVQTGQDY